MRALLVISALLLLASCESLVGHESGVERGISAAKPIVDAVDPLTGGVAGIAYTGLATIATTIFGINRALLAQKHAKVIKNIDSNPDTPKAVDQVAEAKDQQIIIKIVGEKDV